MYESDGSIMVYWHALDTPETPTGNVIFHSDNNICITYISGTHTMSSISAKAIFARGIAAVRDKYICVGKRPKH